MVLRDSTPEWESHFPRKSIIIIFYFFCVYSVVRICELGVFLNNKQ
jgi:hypothetical protein